MLIAAPATRSTRRMNVEEENAFRRGRRALYAAGLGDTAAAVRAVLSLPLHAHLDERDAERVADLIGRILATAPL